MKLVMITMLLMFSQAANSACVILLHGLARTEGSMEKLQNQLNLQGYQTVNQGYLSRDHTIEILAEKAIVPALKQCGHEQEINFVTHSLGGILVRQYLSMRAIPNLKYVIMLGPPNKGSEVVDKLQHMPGFYLINGDAGLQLGTSQLSLPNSLGAANFNVGIIAGNKSLNWILSLLIPGTDDGKVSIERTKLAGMNDHIEIPTTHIFMMKNEQVISQVIYYLNHGFFMRHSNNK